MLTAFYCNIFAYPVITQTTVIPNQQPDFKKVLVFNKFDTNLGKLIDIKIVTAGNLHTEFSIKNISAHPKTVSFWNNLDIQITNIKTGAVINEMLASEQKTYPAVPDKGTVSDSINSFGSNITLYTDFTQFSNFFAVGGGVFNLSFNVEDNSMVSNGSFKVDTESQVNGSISVIYDYEPVLVPEPSSLIMLGMLVLGIATTTKF